MTTTKDYLAMRKVEPGDKVDHGVKGQRWGITRSKAQLAAVKSGSESSESSAKPEASETSQARYARLKSQAASKGAGSMSDDDLKFFNNRTEAMKKVAQLHEKNPNWLKETAQTVIRKTAQESIQQIASSVAKQYVTTPIIKSVGAAPPKKPKKN